MAKSTKKTTSKKSGGKGTQKESKKSSMTPAKKGAASNLDDLFEDSLKDMYWAEKALVKALKNLENNATSGELQKAINDHRMVTQTQADRLVQVFDIIGKKAVAKKCDAMDGLIKEGEGMIEETQPGSVRDAAIIAAAQKVEHYEIASYGTLRQFAETLDLTDAVELLDLTLDEEKGADEKLTEVAVSA
ncbi:MAG: ferritin-like domain-containing protein, partial [Chitinophagales bacterium]|nr:ferritin-like domain-containing protein [Chitinophagales bacterium]